MKNLGAISFIAGTAAVVLIVFFWLFPWGNIHGNESEALVFTGLLATVIAIWAVYSQQVITQRRVTLEHITRGEFDRDLIEARQKFRELVKSPDGIAVWANADKEQSAEFQKLSVVLNQFELISIGIQRGIIDPSLFKRWYRTGTIRTWDDAEPFITALRKRMNNNMAIYHEFQEMVSWFRGEEKLPRRSWWLGRIF